MVYFYTAVQQLTLNFIIIKQKMSSIRDFVPLEKLGEGTYSNVYKVKRLTDQEIYALKKVKMDSLTLKQKQNALNEVRILASIETEHIVGYKEAFFDQNLNVLCVVMEYANQGDLQKLIKQYTKTYKLIPQDQIWKAAQNILKGLQNLHQRGILHRDIKCANIFKCKGFYKLGDLNVSKVNGDKLAYTQTGTPYYASPEVWRDEPYDSKSDIWSFGCIIYEMAGLKPPFQGKDMQELFKSVQKAILKPLPTQYSNQLWEFLSLCLQKDPKKRPSTKQLLQKLDILLKAYQNTHANTSQNYSKINNPQTKKSNQTDALLKTIKVPTDLKKLKDSLPQSKYKKNIPQKHKVNNANIINLNHPVRKDKGAQSQIKLGVKVESSNIVESAADIKSQDKSMIRPNIETNNSLIVAQKVNRSQIFQSPRNFLNQNSYKSPKNRLQVQKSNVQNILLKSPRSQLRLGKKVQSQPKYSQRLYASDKKQSYSNKVEKAFSIQNYIKLGQNNESLLYLKKPSSMPRTQKMQTLINNSSRAVDISVNGNLNNLSHIHKPIGNKHLAQDSRKYQALDEWRKKLVKKTRILSSNHPKPTWWG